MKKEIDCSRIKGVVYLPSYARNDVEIWLDYDRKTVERELEYAKRIGFNCVRVFLSYVVYADNREKFLENLLHLVRTADSYGIKVMPVVFDSCFSEIEPTLDCDMNTWIPNPGVMNLGSHFWPRGEAYCRDLIDLLKNENGLLMWDIMNEPLCTSYVYQYSPEINERHKQEIYGFLKHFCDFFREYDDLNPITVGHDRADFCEETYAWVDILAYHDYSATETGMKNALNLALEIGKKHGMQVFNSETGCPGRANPYDIVVQILNENRTGYVLWDLMIGACCWRDKHGIVYPDGTIRDGAVVAAVSGFFRKRENRTAYNPDIEGWESNALNQMTLWLDSGRNTEAGLNILNMTANLLEATQVVPERDLPLSTYYAMKNNGTTPDAIAEKFREWIPVLKSDIAGRR